MKFLAALTLLTAAAEPEQEIENACRAHTYRYYDHGLRMWRYRTRYFCAAEDSQPLYFNKLIWRNAFEKALKEIDTNKDRKMSKDEILKWHKADPKRDELKGLHNLKKWYPFMDRNKDGSIDIKEHKYVWGSFAERFEKAKKAVKQELKNN